MCRESNDGQTDCRGVLQLKAPALLTRRARSPLWLRRCACVAGVAAWASLTQGCAKPLSDAECTALLDHYTERLLKDENPGVSQQLVAEKQAAARQLVLLDPTYEFAECPSHVSRAQFECAMRAPNVDQIEQCLVM